MTQFTPEQLASMLAALGISAESAPTARDTSEAPSPNNDVTCVVGGVLHSFYCFNCAFPNVVPVNAVPASFAVVQPPLRAQANRSPAAMPSSTSTARMPTVQPTVAPASTPTVSVPDVNAPAPTALAASAALQTNALQGPSVPGPSTVSASDGSWYTVSKGLAVGVFRGWQNVSPLVTGVGRACYFRHSSQAAAQEAFNQAVATGAVEVLH
ncbi:uncharacterized protein ARMOST_15919 [Armillaria ostoyae]|uniref:Ribonuclease H1 N-terminal domain-containing protein n=1 Tax=Armillaria ostoyae TaxID=47428 RepID=A0A284RUS7_ARMOS|nr:uncharacterized protein ARMOST_15919 [Armillaria ostoyae]